MVVLKIELDFENNEHIIVMPGDDPRQVVDDFAKKFNVSEHGKLQLLDQVFKQIEMKLQQHNL